MSSDDKLLSAAADVPIKLTVVLGKARMSLNELLHTQTGSVIELDKAAGDDVDIYAGEVLIARGQLMSDGRSLGVQISEIVNERDCGDAD